MGWLGELVLTRERCIKDGKEKSDMDTLEVR